jgi:hypothetical protein
MTSLVSDISVDYPCGVREMTGEDDVYGARNVLTEWMPPLWQAVEPTVERPKDEFGLWAKLAKRGIRAWLDENPF